MSTPVTDSLETHQPIEDIAELAAWLEKGCKPRERWRIGTEHEKFGFLTDCYSPLPYDGQRGVRRVLNHLRDRFGWEPVMEGDTIIGLREPSARGGAISLEPGGQFELSGAPLATLHQTCDEVQSHLCQLREIGRELDVGFLGLGFSPKWTLPQISIMPKARYAIMRRYMQKVGSRGLDMMFRSCTVQVNLDFSSEADMTRKMRVGLALQPVVTAIFANSPFMEGQPSGFLSLRSDIWRHTDADRTGLLPFVFEEGFGFEAYARYALDVPMYFARRDGVYHDVSGQSFRDFIAGKLPGLPGERATIGDWEDHLTTLFPEVRLKRFIEMRGTDGAPWRGLCALPALWVGLLYDEAALDAAWDLVKGWSEEERHDLRAEVPRTALDTRFRAGSVLDVAREMVAIAGSGLKARARRDPFGGDESHFLGAIEEIVESGRTLAQDLLTLYREQWHGDIDRIFSECAY
ncbi:MAG: glutamate--cysteine ligase [Hyphomicrobiales bacterium]